MLAVILAGGDGSSMKPLTCTKPVAMLRVCGVPLAEYALRKALIRESVAGRK